MQTTERTARHRMAAQSHPLRPPRRCPNERVRSRAICASFPSFSTAVTRGDVCQARVVRPGQLHHIVSEGDPAQSVRAGDFPASVFPTSRWRNSADGIDSFCDPPNLGIRHAMPSAIAMSRCVGRHHSGLSSDRRLSALKASDLLWGCSRARCTRCKPAAVGRSWWPGR